MCTPKLRRNTQFLTARDKPDRKHYSMIWAEYTLIYLHTNEKSGGVQREVSSNSLNRYYGRLECRMPFIESRY